MLWLLLFLLIFAIAAVAAVAATVVARGITSRATERLTRIEMLIQELEQEVRLLRQSGTGGAVQAVESKPLPERAPHHAPEQAWWRQAAPAEETSFDEAGADEREAASSPPVRETLAGLFERFVGGRLLIWIGGIALAVAGVFLVRYSIEIGLITPALRMVGAALFGLLLLAAGEGAPRGKALAEDPRIAQALVGAGILVLYATAYAAPVLYGLISLGTASVLMVLITIGALGLSLRHGAPTAVLGLSGGFLTPLLVGDPAAGAVPLLAYLALLNAAVFLIAARRGWTWLAASAVVLSFVWTATLLFSSPADALLAGLFVVALSVGASMAKAGPGWQIDFLRPAGIGLLQLAALVARVDLGPAAWGLFGLLAAASIFLSSRKAEFRWLPAFALVLALSLLAIKAFGSTDPLLATVAAGITLLFGAVGIAGALRGRDRTMWAAIAAAASAGPVIILRLARPELLELPLWGGLFVLLAMAPLFLAGRGVEQGSADRARFIAASGAALLLGIAATDLLPLNIVGSAWLLIALAAALGSRRLGDDGLALLGFAVAALALTWTVARVSELWSSLAGSLAGDPALVADLPNAAEALQLLLLPVPLLFLLWRLVPANRPRLRAAPLVAGGFLLAMGTYVLFKQIFGLDAEGFVSRGFAERLIITQALFAAGWLLGTGRLRLPGVEERPARLAGVALTAAAAGRLVWFDMLIHNPVFAGQWVGSLPLLNLLAPAYLLSAFWLYGERRRARTEAASGIWLAIFLAALVIGVMLMVRQLFQGAILSEPNMPLSEFYGYSLAGLLLSTALLLAGIRLPDKALRVAGLALLTATILKVFLIDAAQLEGLLRILSFLGLGVALIGIGKLYGTVLSAEAKGSGVPAGK